MDFIMQEKERGARADDGGDGVVQQVHPEVPRECGERGPDAADGLHHAGEGEVRADRCEPGDAEGVRGPREVEGGGQLAAYGAVSVAAGRPSAAPEPPAESSGADPADRAERRDVPG